MIGGLGIVLAFAFLMLAAWRKYNLIIVVPIVAAIIGVTNGFSVIEIWSGPFIEGTVGFFAGFLMIILLGSIFAKLMEDSGASLSIGLHMVKYLGDKYSFVVYMLVLVLLTVGGISGFVIVFIALPLAKVLFKKSNIPWYLFAAATYSACNLGNNVPGNLQIFNIIPTRFLGTELTAGAGFGFIMVGIYAVMLIAYFAYVIKKGRASEDKTDFYVNEEIVETPLSELPNIFLSFIPIVIALVSINVLKIPIPYGLSLASISCLVLFPKRYKDFKTTINTGSVNCAVPIVLASLIVGMSSTISITPAFETFKTWLVSMPGGSLLQVFTFTNALALVTGSTIGSMSTTLALFAETFASLGVNLEIVHRLVVISCSGLDSMPWNSFIVLLITLSKTNYKTAYKHVFMTTVLMTLILGLIGVILGNIFWV